MGLRTVFCLSGLRIKNTSVHMVKRGDVFVSGVFKVIFLSLVDTTLVVLRSVVF